MTLLRPALRWIILSLLVVLALELTFHLVAAPNLRLGKLVFTGDRPWFEGSVAPQLGLREREYYFSVDEETVKGRLESLPWVKSAAVLKKFPDTLSVNLQVRKALALSVVGSTVLSIDDEGLVFASGKDSLGLDLPLISGVSFATLQAGARFPEALRPVFERLAEVRKAAPVLYRMISEIELKANDRGSFDAVLFPTGTPVRILLGDRWDLSTVQQMFVLLDLVRREGLIAKTKEIDFRAMPVVLRPRES